MVIGFDTYHDAALKDRSVGAFVSSTNPELTRYYSQVNFHSNSEELSGTFAINVKG